MCNRREIRNLIQDNCVFPLVVCYNILYNVNKTGKHYLICEHFSLSNVDGF